MDIRVKEVLDFIETFKIALSKYDEIMKEYDDIQRKVISAKSVKEALSKEISELIIKKEKEANQAVDNIAKVDKQIAEQRASLERTIKEESKRLTDWEDKLSTQQKEQEAIKIEQDHKSSVLNEKERVIEVEKKELAQREIDLTYKQNDIVSDRQALAKLSMEVKVRSEELAVREKDYSANIAWFNDAQGGFKKIQEELQKEKAIVETQQINNEREIDRLNQMQKELNKQSEDLDKKKKDIEAQQIVLDKKKKDNDDKERALQAMGK